MCPVPAHTNERGHFSVAFGQFVQRYGKLFTLMTYDASATTQSNMQAVLKAGKHFLFRLRAEQESRYWVSSLLAKPHIKVAFRHKKP